VTVVWELVATRGSRAARCAWQPEIFLGSESRKLLEIDVFFGEETGGSHYCFLRSLRCGKGTCWRQLFLVERSRGFENVQTPTRGCGTRRQRARLGCYSARPVLFTGSAAFAVAAGRAPLQTSLYHFPLRVRERLKTPNSNTCCVCFQLFIIFYYLSRDPKAK
jgi:hypothetical protein